MSIIKRPDIVQRLKNNKLIDNSVIKNDMEQFCFSRYKKNITNR